MSADPGDALAGWTPIRWYRDGDRPMVDWCELGPTRFTDPFFHQTVERVLARPAGSLLRRHTGVEALEAASAAQPGLEPAGFIFHSSRSGSTLLAQMLAASPHYRVLSEPDPVDEILRTGHRSPTAPVDDRIAWLRAMVSVLGRPQGEERRLVVKLDPWHILDFPLIRQAFPDVPWVFSCRDPLEVLASQARSPGSQFVVGPLPTELFGVDLATAASLPPGWYAAQVLDRVLTAAAAHLAAGGLVVEYGDLPGAFDDVLDHVGLHPDAGERRAMAAAADFDAKRPGVPFVPDTEAKRSGAGEQLRAAADAVRPSYERLLAAATVREAVTVG
jgi:Sulfotransferase family